MLYSLSMLLRPSQQARKGEADSTPDDIMQMVKAQCAPAHRLILFLQQSSVEWCSSLWMHVIQEVDPHFQRTVSGAQRAGTWKWLHQPGPACILFAPLLP